MADNTHGGREEKPENLGAFKTNRFIPKTTNNNSGPIDRRRDTMVGGGGEERGNSNR